MKPLNHAMGTERRHGGRWQDYLEIHSLFDSSKATFATTSHRALLHNELGIELAARIFSETIVNSDGISLSVRDIAREHMEEDVGFVPTLDDWLAAMPAPAGARRTRMLPPHLARFANDPTGAAAAHFGGIPEDYRQVAEFFDLASIMSPDPRSVSFLHNSFGIWLCERVIGPAIRITMPEGHGKLISPREFGEALVPARMDGFIHPPSVLFGNLRILPWMRGADIGEARRARKAAASEAS